MSQCLLLEDLSISLSSIELHLWPEGFIRQQLKKMNMGIFLKDQGTIFIKIVFNENISPCVIIPQVEI